MENTSVEIRALRAVDLISGSKLCLLDQFVNNGRFYANIMAKSLPLNGQTSKFCRRLRKNYGGKPTYWKESHQRATIVFKIDTNGETAEKFLSRLKRDIIEMLP